MATIPLPISSNDGPSIEPRDECDASTPRPVSETVVWVVVQRFEASGEPA